MPTLYRVFPFLARAAPKAPGGALYVPSQGGGRLDNPEMYSVLYMSDASAGAVAEAFGRFPEWTRAILRSSPALTGSRRALARYRLADDAPMCNLDDPEQLQKLRLRPSDVVSRDYARTREWARRIHQSGAWAGVRWWSYYDPQWSSFGLWDLSRLDLIDIRPLHLDDPWIIEASASIAHRIVLRTARQATRGSK